MVALVVSIIFVLQFGTFILRLNDTFVLIFFEKSVQFRLGTGFGTNKSPSDSCAVAL